MGKVLNDAMDAAKAEIEAWSDEDMIRRGFDPINPQHYKGAGGLEVIDVIEAFGLQHDYYLATALKYILRAGKKASAPAAEDIAKAVWFLTRYSHLPLPQNVPVCKTTHQDSPQTEHLVDGIAGGRE